MASIRVFLAELEARLAPAFDAQSLQERLTEAEVHLRDRAQEFEEIGLPPLEAEARAVAAFGDAEEYAEDVPRQRPAPPKAETTHDLSLRPVAAVLALGAIAALVSGNPVIEALGIPIAVLVAVAMFGFGALRGRVVRLRRLLALGLAASIVLFGMLCAGFVPSPQNGPVRPRFSPEGGLAYRKLKAFDAYRQQVSYGVDPPKATWEQLSEAGIVTNGSAALPAGTTYYAAPGLDASSGTYAIYRDVTEAFDMWAQNGRFMRRRLLLEAMQGGYADELDPDFHIRQGAFAPVALEFFVAFVALALLAQALGTGLRNGGERFRRRLHDRDAANPPVGTFHRF